MSKYTKKNKLSSYLPKIVVFILAILLTIAGTAVVQKIKYEARINELEAVHESDMIALRTELRDSYEAEIFAIRQYYEFGGDITEIEQEATLIAQLMYGMDRPAHSDGDRREMVWCVLNRVDNPAYPDTILEVCEQEKQWIGFSHDNPILAHLYDIALAELKKWHNNEPRPMNTDYVYLSWSSSEIELRNTFTATKSTNYWNMD